MGIGKKTWSEELKPKVGAFERFDLHYGLARYALVPLSAGLTLASNRPDLDSTNLLQQRQVNEVPQIRIERMEVQIKGRDSVSTAAWYNNVASVSVRCSSQHPVRFRRQRRPGRVREQNPERCKVHDGDEYGKAVHPHQGQLRLPTTQRPRRICRAPRDQHGSCWTEALQSKGLPHTRDCPCPPLQRKIDVWMVGWSTSIASVSVRSFPLWYPWLCSHPQPEQSCGH
jgi:hypothetical protein